MSEKTGEQFKMTRRDLLGAAVITGAKLITPKAIGKKIENLSTNGIEINTSWATFFPLYENHLTAPVCAEELPPNLDSLWIEMVYLNRERRLLNHNTSPQELVRVSCTAPENQRLIIAAANKDVPLCFGDIVVPTELSISKEEIEGFISKALPVLAALSVLTRRQFLATVTTAVGLKMINQTLHSLTPYFWKKHSSHPFGQVVSRVAQRINGITSHFNPEDFTFLFRNLVWVQKLSHFAKINEGKPRIAIEAGANHSGIEDLLYLGPSVTEKLLRAFPSPIVEKIVETNDGPISFSGLTIIQLPTSLTPKQIETDDWQPSDKKFEIVPALRKIAENSSRTITA